MICSYLFTFETHSRMYVCMSVHLFVREKQLQVVCVSERAWGCICVITSYSLGANACMNLCMYNTTEMIVTT